MVDTARLEEEVVVVLSLGVPDELPAWARPPRNAMRPGLLLRLLPLPRLDPVSSMLEPKSCTDTVAHQRLCLQLLEP